MRGSMMAAGVAMLVLAGCKPAADAPAVDTAKVSSEIEASVAAMTAAYNGRDAAKAASVDAPDYVSMFHGMPNTVGPAADEAAMKAQLADPAAKITFTKAAIDVSQAGDLAVYRSTYVYDYTDPKTKQPAKEFGNWVAAYKRQADGGMKMIWSIASDTPPAKPAA